MKKGWAALVCGLIFALGLGISGMTQVGRVVGFLDVFGAWQPALIFVMGGAIVVHFFAYRWIIRQPSPLFDREWHVPTRKDITLPLVGGAFIFGLGWGLGGFCPGPALVSLASGQSRPVIFVGSMLLGMVIYRLIFSRKVSSP
ncbi:MAG: YeeE/YedE family protein [Chitinophagaceae bacterium]|nr:YeeE/YedE family protein [Oligoflexus sp.]